MKTTHINISISGPTGSGKSAIIESIRQMLEGNDLCVVYPDRSMRKNPPEPLHEAAGHEKPKVDSTVIALEEINRP